MTETVRLMQSVSALELTLTATPLSEGEINLAVALKPTPGEFPLAQGKVKYGFTGGTLKLNLKDADFTRFSEEINNYLPVTKFPTFDHPTWKFALPAGLDLLKTDAEAITLGTVIPTSENWSFEATFTVGKADILIPEVEGLWRHDLRPNQQAILHRKLALFLWETQLPSPLISLQTNHSTAETSPPLPNEADTSSLLTILEKIKTSPSHDFLELCEIANLNPNLDFAGANLRGTTLRGLDLNGANWSRVNLRGADLTDIDLSQGNLQGAKLSGADLSGAYLSNANLKEADFHRASLALANLSGANLQGANLQEANLSQTNLNDCHLSSPLI